MFFDYKIFKNISDKKVFLGYADLILFDTDNSFISEYLSKVCAMQKSNPDCIICKSIELIRGLTPQIKEKISALSGEEYSYNADAYCINAGEATKIYAETEKGIIHAISTLKQLTVENELKEAFIFDTPYINKTGFRCFIPGRAIIDDFKQMIDDILVSYKYNFLFLEVGGAMEYKKHPKINAEWEIFCKKMLSESGVADKLQHFTYPWSKNSIHPENGCGSYLTQAELKELIKYCKDRGIDVYPEVPSLSHSDYIVRAYPELNERAEDKDPDTYCPSNPKTYEVLFDILDEILEVFEGTEYMAIGHDEVVTIGICDKCKTKDPTDIFAGDIRKIYEYLKSKNIKTLMYGDKFTQLRDEKGSPYIDAKGKLCGGLESYEKGNSAYVPALYPSLEKVPKEIGIMDWYWSFNFDDTFKERDVYFANFNGMFFESWRERTRREIKAISASNWGRSDYVNMQRNGIICSLIFNAHMGWSHSYDDDKKESLLNATLKELNRYYKNNILKMDSDKKYVTVTHTTDFSIPYRYFYDGDFVVENDFYIGDYIISYTDSTSISEPVIYGKNISNEKLDTKTSSPSLIEVSGASVPTVADGKTYYTWTFENSCPDKEISDISFKAADGFNANVSVYKIEY